MKTQEFIEKLELWGLEVSTEENTLFIDMNDCLIATTKTSEENILYIHNGFNLLIENSFRGRLLELLYEYATTPVNERNPKYYIKHKHLSDKNGYLNYLEDDEDEPEEEKWFFSDLEPIIETNELKFSFTLEELPDWVHKMIEDGYITKEEVE